MAEIVRQLNSPEYWFNALCVGLPLSVLANLLTIWLQRNFSGNWLRNAIIGNALVVPLLAVSPYSTVIGVWYFDLAFGCIFAATYCMVAITPSNPLRAFALLAPNVLMAVASVRLYQAGAEDVGLMFLSAYPIAILFCMFLLMPWLFVVHRRLARSEIDRPARA